MLVFAGITPHTPLILPSVNKDRMHIVEETTRAMQELSEELYATHPDTIIIISEHPTIYSDSFSLNLHDPYRFDLSEFGDFGFPLTVQPDLRTADALQRSIRAQNQPLTLTSDDALNYAAAVPVFWLTKESPNMHMIALTFCERDAKAHFQFGQALKDVIFSSDRRIAVIASGDLSHALTSASPEGFHKDGAEFDKKIQEIVTQKNTTGLLAMDEDFVRSAREASYRQIAILFGLLERVSVRPHILSYEAPVGVGYLVANLSLA